MKLKSYEDQPELFSVDISGRTAEIIALFALGDFQARGCKLAGRELAIDRLRGAFKRAAEQFGAEEFSDERIAAVLENLGAAVRRVPNYVAKHPFRVIVGQDLADRAKAQIQSST